MFVYICTGVNESQKIDSTNYTQKESTVDGLDTTLGNLNKKDERWSVDSILEPTTAVMDL